MKRSDVEWLGQVPAHWEVTRLGRFGKFLKGNGGTKDDEASSGIPCVRYGDLYTTHEFVVLQARSFVSKEKVKDYTSIRFGDVLFVASGETIDEIGKSAANLIPSEACCGGDVIIFRPSRGVDARYIGYATDCLPSRIQKATMGRGITVMHVYGHQLKRLSLALPPFPEQTAIVRFLDYADRRIQHYIRTKEKLIALLEEQKQAIIHQAVTGEIDVRTGQPYRAYKDSGVGWLGEVPKHWNVRRLKTICSMKSGEGITATSIEPTGQYPVYGGNGLRGYTSGYTHDGAYALIGRQGALCGNVHLGQGCFWASEHAVVADLHRGHVLEWFGAILEVMNLNQYSIAAAQPGLAVERILNLWLPVPDPREQALIGTYIRTQTANISLNIERARRQGDLLQEYRTRLIADVVTGKLDVRRAAATLPKVDPLARGDVDDPLDLDVDSVLEELETVKEVAQ